MTQPTKVSIIIPTYNEEFCIEKTIESLQPYITSDPDYDITILIFDSNSTDSTVEKIEHLQNKYQNIVLKQENSKSGLGSAYIQAMQYAMNTLHSDIVFEYDADGSHKPHYIPEFLKKLEHCDCVVGSRYIPGGAVDKDWGFHRKLLSRGASWLSQLFLSPRYKDYTSGFRATKTTLLKKVGLENLLSKQYAYKIHLFWALHKAGAKIEEYPIEFVDRQEGYSKLPKNNIFESVVVLTKLRCREMKRLFKMVLTGLAGLAVQFILFNILRIHLHAAPANTIAIEAAIITNFFMHNTITFRDFKLSKEHRLRYWLYKLGKFNLFSLSSMFLQTIIMFLGVSYFGSSFMGDNILLIIGMAAGTVSNYFLYTKFVWQVK